MTLRPTPWITAGRHSSGAVVVGCFCLALLAACSQGPSAVHLPSVDASEAAAYAMEHYDTNHDGALDAAEMAHCPPLVVAIDSYDADGNGRLSAEEIEGRINRLYGPGAALTNVDCAVALSGRPLRGATVTFRPVEMLGASVQRAQGVTDESGIARIAMTDGDLPDDLKGAPLMQPGLYYVEITHPEVTLPARYNASSELGFEVDPSRRGGTSARFDLRSK